MKNKKSCGYDNVPAIVYKNSENTLMKLLMKLFNDSLEIGRFPKSWKTAKVIFIKKPDKTDKEDPKSYRPISLLPVISKIMEKVINARLLWHSYQKSIIHTKQFGFQAGTGAEHAALNLTNDIFTAFKKRKETVAVFLDARSAFPLSLIHISSPRDKRQSRMPSSA